MGLGAERIEEGSSALVRRVVGKPVPAKAVATRQLKAATRKAAAARKRITKTATREVSQAVADTATSALNAACRFACRAETTTKRVNKAVTVTATQTSSAPRRVARKARTVAAEAWPNAGSPGAPSIRAAGTARSDSSGRGAVGAAPLRRRLAPGARTVSYCASVHYPMMRVIAPPLPAESGPSRMTMTSAPIAR